MLQASAAGECCVRVLRPNASRWGRPFSLEADAKVTRGLRQGAEDEGEESSSSPPKKKKKKR